MKYKTTEVCVCTCVCEGQRKANDYFIGVELCFLNLPKSHESLANRLTCLLPTYKI
jgi:hypothetical protein